MEPKNNENSKIDLYYFTDPLCSHCWALDTVLTRFKYEYQAYINIHTVMGALVEDDNHYLDLKGPEAKEQASHWDQISRFYHVPLNSRVWHKDPITSSFPSSITFLYLQEHHPDIAPKFLRLTREAAFLFEKNIAKRSVLADLLNQLKIDSDPILDFSFSEKGKELLHENLAPMDRLSVSTFPTVVMINANQEAVKVIGSRTMDVYKKALKKVLPESFEYHPTELPPLSEFLEIMPTLFWQDLEKLYDIPSENVGKFINSHMKDIPYTTGKIAGYRYIQKK